VFLDFQKVDETGRQMLAQDSKTQAPALQILPYNEEREELLPVRHHLSGADMCIVQDSEVLNIETHVQASAYPSFKLFSGICREASLDASRRL